jgi:hypothetical protein
MFSFIYDFLSTKINIILNGNQNMLPTSSEPIYHHNLVAYNHEEKPKKPENKKLWYPNVVRSMPQILPSAYLPYMIIKEMTAHYAVPFVQASSQLLFQKSCSPREAETSCVLNLFALSIIFSGVKGAVTVKGFLGYHHKESIGVNLPNGERWYYTIDNLFTGSILTAYNKNIPQRCCLDAFIRFIQSTYLQHYFDSTHTIIDRCFQVANTESSSKVHTNSTLVGNIVNALKALKFDFNKPIMDSLSYNLDNNSQQVNEKVSFIYFVAIIMPQFYCYKEVLEDRRDRKTFYHAFAIEQFRSQNGVSHRLYHAWINRMTLKEYFQQQNYGSTNEGCLSLDQMHTYLTEVGWIISPHTHPSAVPYFRQRCFGQATPGVHKAHYYDESKNSLIGLSLRYFYCKISPADAVKNSREFIRQYINC